MGIVEEVIVIVIEDTVVTPIASLNYPEARIPGRVIASTAESTEVPVRLGTVDLDLIFLESRGYRS